MLMHSDSSSFTDQHADVASSSASPSRSDASKSTSRATSSTTGCTTAADDPYASSEIIAIASATAAVLTKSTLHPLDTLKCRVQLLRCDAAGPTASSSGLLRTRIRQLHHQYAGQWSPRYLYGGLPVKLAFYVPYQALYLSSYNYAQRSLMEGEDLLEDEDGKQHRSSHYLRHTVAAAVFAEVASSGLRVPMETMKMRVQSTVSAGSWQALVQLWRQGARSTARLVIPNTLVHDIPYSVIQWTVYETLRPWTQEWGATLAERRLRVSNASSPSFLSRYGAELTRTFLSGGLSGLIASTATVPLDNIRTRVVVATARDPQLTVTQVVHAAYDQEGLRGFVRGGGMRVLWVTSNMACFYPLFEGIRTLLQATAAAEASQN